MSNGREITLGQYLIGLAENPDLVAAFRANPERAMDGAQLSEEDRDLILTHDIEAVRRKLAEEFGGTTLAVMICPPTICGPPPPPPPPGR
jgi:hypothetical protein